MIRPEELIGDQVMYIRKKHKLSRQDFSMLCGFHGKSTGRLVNIEKNDNWRTGNREAVAHALNVLEGFIDERFHSDLLSDDEDEDSLIFLSPLSSTDQVVEKAEPPGYVVSNSSLTTWNRCRRKWWLAWYRKLALRHEDPTNLRATGTRIHRALEAWYVPQGQSPVDPRDALERVLVEDWTTIVSSAGERNLDEEGLVALADQFQASAALERAMIEGYFQWITETGADAELEVIAPETVLSANFEVDVNGEKRPVRAVGTIDARVRRTTDGVRMALDHKTTADFTGSTATLHMAPQMLHYHMLEWLNTPEGEQRCDGALYNMLRRVKRTARATPPFYQRVEIRHNEHELESYKRRMLAAARDMMRTTDALDAGADHQDVAYPTPTPNCRWDCDFFPVCPLFDDGSRVEDMLSALYLVTDPQTRYAARLGPRGEEP